jgi:hypothetical protein
MVQSLQVSIQPLLASRENCRKGKKKVFCHIFEQLVGQLIKGSEFASSNPATAGTQRKLRNRQKRKFSEADT